MDYPKALPVPPSQRPQRTQPTSNNNNNQSPTHINNSINNTNGNQIKPINNSLNSIKGNPPRSDRPPINKIFPPNNTNNSNNNTNNTSNNKIKLPVQNDSNMLPPPPNMEIPQFPSSPTSSPFTSSESLPSLSSSPC